MGNLYESLTTEKQELVSLLQLKLQIPSDIRSCSYDSPARWHMPNSLKVSVPPDWIGAYTILHTGVLNQHNLQLVFVQTLDETV